MLERLKGSRCSLNFFPEVIVFSGPFFFNSFFSELQGST